MVYFNKFTIIAILYFNWNCIFCFVAIYWATINQGKHAQRVVSGLCFYWISKWQGRAEWFTSIVASDSYKSSFKSENSIEKMFLLLPCENSHPKCIHHIFHLSLSRIQIYLDSEHRNMSVHWKTRMGFYMKNHMLLVLLKFH